MIETLETDTAAITAGALPPRTIIEVGVTPGRPPVGNIHPHMQALLDAEAGREERIRLGDIRTAKRPPLPVITDGA
mgnify:CR=1 FL=1